MHVLNNKKIQPLSLDRVIFSTTFQAADTSAEDFLSKNELNYLHTYPKNKLLSWCAGRRAAKMAIAECVAENFNLFLEPYEIELIPRQFQKPGFSISSKSISIENRGTIESAIVFSISHSQNTTIALACDLNLNGMMGIDVEHVRSFAPRTAEAFLTADEFYNYRKLPLSRQDEQATRLWCIKEAYLKATGYGLRIHPQRVEILETEYQKYVLKKDGRVIQSSIQWALQDTFVVSCVQIPKS